MIFRAFAKIRRRTTQIGAWQLRLVAFLVVAIIAGALYMTWQHDEIGQVSANSDTAGNTLAIVAKVVWTHQAFLVKNEDSFIWNRCKLEVDALSFGDGYSILLDKVAPGQEIRIDGSKFKKNDQSYDLGTQEPQRFTIRCQDANGQIGAYLGRVK